MGHDVHRHEQTKSALVLDPSRERPALPHLARAVAPAPAKSRQTRENARTHAAQTRSGGARRRLPTGQRCRTCRTWCRSRWRCFAWVVVRRRSGRGGPTRGSCRVRQGENELGQPSSLEGRERGGAYPINSVSRSATASRSGALDGRWPICPRPAGRSARASAMRLRCRCIALWLAGAE